MDHGLWLSPEDRFLSKRRERHHLRNRDRPWQGRQPGGTLTHPAPQPEPDVFRLLAPHGLVDTALSLPVSVIKKYFRAKPRPQVLSGPPQFRHVNSSLFIFSAA